MAKIETRQLPENSRITTVIQAIRALRGAAADECSAQNLYSEIIEYLNNGNVPNKELLISRLTEIMHDEENHLGSLLWMVGELDRSIAANMQEGAKGV